MKKLYEKLDHGCMKLDSLLVEFIGINEAFEKECPEADYNESVEEGLRLLRAAQDSLCNVAAQLEMEIEEADEALAKERKGQQAFYKSNSGMMMGAVTMNSNLNDEGD